MAKKDNLSPSVIIIYCSTLFEAINTDSWNKMTHICHLFLPLCFLGFSMYCIHTNMYINILHSYSYLPLWHHHSQIFIRLKEKIFVRRSYIRVCVCVCLTNAMLLLLIYIFYKVTQMLIAFVNTIRYLCDMHKYMWYGKLFAIIQVYLVNNAIFFLMVMKM